MMRKVLELDEDFNNGSVHDFFILYYGSLPEYMGGSSEKARKHFKKAENLSKGRSASPYLSLASTVSIKEQNIKEFKYLLNQVLKIDPDQFPSLRLQNTIYQRKARWMLEHMDEYFVEIK
jgi:tetratricopeptide (TPR) repeat protein